MKSRFILRGNVPSAIRSDRDMCAVDPKAADRAFQTQKKILGAFLKEKGFVRYRTNSFIRRNEMDVLEYFDLQKESHGSKTMTANYALIPLYIPHSFLSFDLGDRLGMLICGRDVWWDYADDAAASVSFGNIMQAIEVYLLPWFAERSTVDSLKQALLHEERKRKKWGGRLSDLQQKWLESCSGSPVDRDVIAETIKVLKLPANLC